MQKFYMNYKIKSKEDSVPSVLNGLNPPECQTPSQSVTKNDRCPE